MTLRSTPWPAGTPCWTDLMSDDVDRARAFYAAVLGWSFQETGPEFGGYVLATRRDHQAAGIGPVMEGARTGWTLYFASDDAQATHDAVAAAGGTPLSPPIEVGPLGVMFVALDPTGAVFGVWQAKEHLGAGITNEPGGLTWEDLRTPDPGAAQSFYSQVFGFEHHSVDMAPDDYRTFHPVGDDAPLGGIGPMMGADGPAHWSVLFAVDDLDVALAAVVEHDGGVTQPRFETPYGPMAGVVDPDCSALMLGQMSASNAQPDR